MASQDKTDKRKALEKQAKELGMKGIHFFKTEESLEAGIVAKQADAVKTEPKLEVEVVAEELEVVEAVQEKEVVESPKSKKRKAPPRMNIANIGNDDRTAMITRLEREDPECTYVMQSSSITPAELAAKGLERTEYSVKNDIVCRTLKEGFTEFQREKNKAAFDAMQRIDGGTGIVGNHSAQAKTPQLADN